MNHLCLGLQEKNASLPIHEALVSPKIICYEGWQHISR